MIASLSPHPPPVSGGSYTLVIIPLYLSWQQRQQTLRGGYKQILFNAIDIALKAGVMIGYNARKAEEREATRKTQKGNNI